MEWIGVRNALTTDDVNAVQKEMGVRLPDDYIKKIGAINAGGLVDSIVNHPQLGEIAYSRNIPLDKKTKGNIFELYPTFSGREKDLYPFATVGNGDFYCFDLKNGGVVLWIHEIETIEKICGTFTELLDLLTKD